MKKRQKYHRLLMTITTDDKITNDEYLRIERYIIRVLRKKLSIIGTKPITKKQFVNIWSIIHAKV